MNKVVIFMNRLADIDGGWWPLLKCRPEKNEYMDNRKVLKITPFFGTITGLIAILLSATFGNLVHAAIYMVSAWLTFFIAYRLTFSVAWNIRADGIKSMDSV